MGSEHRGGRACDELIAAVRARTPMTIVVGAGASRGAPANLPAALPLLGGTLRALREDETVATIAATANADAQLFTLEHRLPTALVPPEAVYGALHERLGAPALRPLDCLRGGAPNANHRILAALVAEQPAFVDVVTTNFDDLIERALHEANAATAAARIWHVHGTLDQPDTLVTTMRRVGRKVFDRALVDRFTRLLDDRVVMFLGYGGTDPDLIPAFGRARPRAVFWSVYDDAEKRRKEGLAPWLSLRACSARFTPIVGDMFKAILQPVAAECLPGLAESLQTPDVVKPAERARVAAAVADWRLPAPDRVAAVLHVLYVYAIATNLPEDWRAVEEVAQAAAGYFDGARGRPAADDRLRRELIAFRAEAVLMRGGPAYRERARSLLAAVIGAGAQDVTQVQLLLNAATLESAFGAWTEAEAHLSKALTITTGLPPDAVDDELRALLSGRIHGSTGTTRAARDDFDGALASFRRAAADFEACGDLSGFAAARRQEILCLMKLGRTAQTRALLDETRGLLEGYSHPDVAHFDQLEERPSIRWR
jgi:hypothetical protein